MIIWINGAFGTGKTQTAYELHRRIPNSFVYDPENIGAFLNRNLPTNIKKADFQDYELWRSINCSVIKHIEENYKGLVIIPMTIVNLQYYHEIISALIQQGLEVKHFTLMASKATLLKRLKRRGDGANSWPAKQIDRCLQGLKKEEFQQHIYTDDLSIEEVAEKIASLSDIKFLPNNDGKLKKKLYRIKIQLKQMRIFNCF